jgi:acetyl-CoA acyltransferase
MSRVFICDYIRTPIGRYGGSLSSVRTDDLAAHPLRALQDRNQSLDWDRLDEVILGCANQAGEDNRNVARMACLLAGLPKEVPALTVNRLCASGMDAVASAYRAIRCDEASMIIAGGVESMSRAPMVMPKADAKFSRKAEIYDTTIGWRFVNKELAAKYGTASMPETAENVALAHGISRADQDAFALASQIKTKTAQTSGRLAQEISGVTIPQREGDPVIVSQDEHPRETTLDKLSALGTPFRQSGTVTAGNASGVNDGAAALLIASEAIVKAHGLTPLAEIIGYSTAGIAPDIMGMGPVPAVRKLCKLVNCQPKDFDLIELNEAFAAQSLAVLRELSISDNAKHVNPNGGAIALGHPLGMTGARIVGTCALEIGSNRASLALATMCVGVGQGVAMSLSTPQI